MWSNNRFENSGDFPNNFNNQDRFPPSPFGAGPVGQQYFPQFSLHQNMMQFEGGNGGGITNNDFQPEVRTYNEEAFSQNQFVHAANPQVSCCLLSAVFPAFVQRPMLYLNDTCMLNRVQLPSSHRRTLTRQLSVPQHLDLSQVSAAERPN